jgi:hypothetical protein
MISAQNAIGNKFSELTDFFGRFQSFVEVVNHLVTEFIGQQTKTMAKTQMQIHQFVTVKHKDKPQSLHPKTQPTLVPKIVLLNLKMLVASTNRDKDNNSKIPVSLSFI